MLTLAEAQTLVMLTVQAAESDPRQWGYSKHYEKPDVEKPAFKRGAFEILDALDKAGAFKP